MNRNLRFGIALSDLQWVHVVFGEHPLGSVTEQHDRRQPVVFVLFDDLFECPSDGGLVAVRFGGEVRDMAGLAVEVGQANGQAVGVVAVFQHTQDAIGQLAQCLTARGAVGTIGHRHAAAGVAQYHDQPFAVVDFGDLNRGAEPGEQKQDQNGQPQGGCHAAES